MKNKACLLFVNYWVFPIKQTSFSQKLSPMKSTCSEMITLGMKKVGEGGQAGRKAMYKAPNKSNLHRHF